MTLTGSQYWYNIVLIMRTYSSTEIIKTLRGADRSFFTNSDISRIFDIKNTNTLYKKLQRLEKRGLIEKIGRGKYIFSLNPPSEFTLANFLYSPSYVSFESALSFYQIITGFPYTITSATVKKTKKYKLQGKKFSYTQISRNLFWGFEKRQDFLIADREKALIDFFYLAFKGLRQLDLSELELSEINLSKLKQYQSGLSNKSFSKFIKRNT